MVSGAWWYLIACLTETQLVGRKWSLLGMLTQACLGCLRLAFFRFSKAVCKVLWDAKCMVLHLCVYSM